jgi:predicted secreted protein
LAAGLIVACLGFATYRENAMADEPRIVTVTEKDNKATVKLAKGDTLVLRLPEQSGTGFGWKVLQNKEEVLTMQGKVQTELPEKPLPGGKVTKVWSFKAERAGASEFEMHYLRPFDDPKKTPPAKTFRLLVKVE